MPPRKSSNLDATLARATKDEVEIDFSGARESNDFAPLVPGDYDAEVHSCEPGTSASGNPKLVFQFKVTEAGPYAGRILFKHVPTKGDGSGIARDVLNALGFDTATMRKFKPTEALGLACVLSVAIQKDNPDFNEVKKVKAAAKAKVGATSKTGRSTRSTRLG